MITISKDKSKLQIAVIHQYLTESYWGKGRSIEAVQKTIDHCLCYGVYLEGKQIGFARIATDYTVFAYLMDVFILPKFQGKGYSKQLMQTLINDAELETCTVWMLKTSDAHGLYEQFGFTDLKNPTKVMERLL
ncbi:N-acetyltransferase [Polaribacter pacificus]|uniref:N-acetyltransferase n=1 Tax=Polaribacter pacificus TaxID=1775173 RepID=A0A917HYT2_9FLAO|nr:GNAT family N-acetyltransferase [Polaribacter pacificus]GGG96516.1 N-acetyltransferase [Polaribacter pacificus]